MAILHPTPVRTDAFHRGPDGIFAAEHSDLGSPAFTRVWDDACDVGLTLVSHKTGREVVFAISDEKRDGEGDIMWWDLRPADPAFDFLPTFRIFND